MDDAQRRLFKRLNDIIVAYTTEKTLEIRQEFFRDVHTLHRNHLKSIFDIYKTSPQTLIDFVEKWDKTIVRKKKIESLLYDEN